MTQRRTYVKEGKKLIELRTSERAFLRLCCMDIPYRSMAIKMGKSPRTLDGIRDALFEKLRVRSRTGLILWCFKTGFVKIKDINLIAHNRKKRQ